MKIISNTNRPKTIDTNNNKINQNAKKRENSDEKRDSSA